MNTIAFWNVYNKIDYDLVSELCRENHLDILVLAEIGHVDPVTIGMEISRRCGRVYSYANPQSFRIKIYSALGHAAITPVMDYQYFSAVKISPPLGPEYLLVGVHLPSKDSQEGVDQAAIAQRVSTHIRNIEKNHNITRTIVLGDFNMNPFEPGLVNSDSFHAVMDRSIASKGERTVLFETHPFFYNPMWGLQGDTSFGPPGSYYQSRSQPVCYFWNMFDQVLFRPELLRYLPNIPVIIIDKINGVPLLRTDGYPNVKISDHLPIKILFKSDNEV